MLKTFAYHKPSVEGLRRTQLLRTALSTLHQTIMDLAPESRERSLALTKLEEVAFWGVKSVVINDPKSETEK